jgi:YHS domain-containing protein
VFSQGQKNDRAERDSMVPEWRKKMKSATAIFGLCALCIITMFIIAPTQVWAKSYINKNWKGLAIKGYDPVAYFTLGKPVKGKKEFEYKWQDARWRFSNEDHLNLFKSDPEKYAPQYGGY